MSKEKKCQLTEEFNQEASGLVPDTSPELQSVLCRQCSPRFTSFQSLQLLFWLTDTDTPSQY